MSPTARSLKLLREMGYEAQVVEQTVTRYVKRDLFGCIDILGIMDGRRILAIQTTSSNNHSTRVKKALAEPHLITWAKAGGAFEVWSWGKKGPRGKRKTWQVKKAFFTVFNGKMAFFYDD